MERSRRLLGALSFALSLCVPAFGQSSIDIDRATHVLNRVGYGSTPALQAQLEVSVAATEDYIETQLFPPGAGASDFNGSPLIAPVVAFATPAEQGDPASLVNIGGVQLAYASLSEWQLREVMTQFWEAHFNTATAAKAAVLGFQTVDDNNFAVVSLEWEINQVFRASALGTFRDLLVASSRHPTMAIYLDSYINTKAGPNENFARELLELHTMGREALNGTLNFSQQDVATAARIFTGWGFYNNLVSTSPDRFQTVFAFNGSDHDQGNKRLFSGTASPVLIAGQSGPTAYLEGEQFLDVLANRSQTIEFICAKLMRYFISETAVTDHPNLFSQVQAAWGVDGDLKAVLRKILKSPAFVSNSNNRRRQSRNPLQFVAALPRNLSASWTAVGQFTNPYVTMLKSGQDLFNFPAPDGFPSDWDEMVSTSVTRERILYVYDSVLLGSGPGYDITALVNAEFGGATPTNTQVAEFMLTRMYGAMNTGWTSGDRGRIVTAMNIGAALGLSNDWLWRGAAVIAGGMVQGSLK